MPPLAETAFTVDQDPGGRPGGFISLKCVTFPGFGLSFTERRCQVLSESSVAWEQKFVGLLVSHQSLIRAYVISLMPGLPEAEDVIQNTSHLPSALDQAIGL